MEDAEKAGSFVEKLANDLLRLGQLNSFDKAAVWEYFDTNVLELEDGNPELMSFLAENRQTYGKKLIKLAITLASDSCNMQTSRSGGKKSGALQPLPYNLYASKKVKKTTVQEHYSNPSSIYSAYLSERMVHLKDSKALLKLLKRCLNSSVSPVPCSWVHEIRKLCAIASTGTEPRVLQLAMEVFNVKLSSVLECGSNDEEWLSDVKSSVEDFATFCLRKHEQVGEFPKKPRFCDLLAATLSMFADVVLLSVRNKSVSDQEKEGKKLCASICYVFRDHPEFILDVVIQLSECQSSDGSVLLPLCKKALSKPVGNVDSVFYTKYMVASCQCKRRFPVLMSDVIAQVRDVAAPADYMDWLKEKNSSILEVLPAKKHFSNFRITKFLLENATDDLLNKLLDVLTDADVVTEERLDGAQMTSEDHDADDMFFFDRASNSQNAGFLQEEAMEIVEVENAEEPVEDHGDSMISHIGRTVCETEIVICFDRGSAVSPESHAESFEEHKKKASPAEQKKLVRDRLADETDEIKLLEGIVEEVDEETNVEKIHEHTTSSEEIVGKEIEKVNASDVRKTDSFAVEISDESEDEESREVLTNRVPDWIKIGDTSDSDMFEDCEEISREKIVTSEQSQDDVETEFGSTDFEGDVVEAGMGVLGAEGDIMQEASKNHNNEVELTSDKLKDETELCISLSEVNDKISSPRSDKSSAAKSKSKRKSADNIIKFAKEKTISTASNTYTMLKSREETPERPKKDQEKHWSDSDDEISINPLKHLRGSRDKKDVNGSSTDLVMIDNSAAFPSQCPVLACTEKIISIQSESPKSLKSQNDSLVKPKQLRQSKSAADSLCLPSAWSSNIGCSTPQSPAITLERTIIADSTERCSAKSPRTSTKSPVLPNFKKFLMSPGKIIDDYEFTSDIDQSPVLPYTRLAKHRGPEHGALSPNQPMEKADEGCIIFEGASGSRSSESPETFSTAHTYSRVGKRGKIRRDLLPELGDVKQNEISDVVESSSSTPTKVRMGACDAESRAGSEDPEVHLARRRSVRIQNKLINAAAKDSMQDILSSPVVKSRKRKAGASMEDSSMLQS